MKKLFLPLLITSIVLSSCGKKDEPASTIKLDPANIEMKFGETKTITPIYTGAAGNLRYEWTSSADSIVSISPTRVGVIEAKRIGEAVITVRSTDKKIKISSSTKVTVTPLSVIFGNIYFQYQQSRGLLKQSMSGYTEDGKYIILPKTPSGTTLVNQFVYEFDGNTDDSKLTALYAYVESNSENIAKAEQYIKERFRQMPGNSSKSNVIFWDAAVSSQPNYSLGTIVGIFTDADPGNGITGTGIKFANINYLK